MKTPSQKPPPMVITFAPLDHRVFRINALRAEELRLATHVELLLSQQRAVQRLIAEVAAEMEKEEEREKKERSEKQ